MAEEEKQPEVMIDKEIFDSVKIELTDEDIQKLAAIEAEAQNLSDEFSLFLKEKIKIEPDNGVKSTISTGIEVLDAVLGGGFVIGALNIIIGLAGSGKSMLAAQVLGRAQQQFQGKLIGGYLDSEESMTRQRLANLGVLYPQLSPYDDITVEKVFKFLEGLCLFKEQKKINETPSVVIWDSIANTLSEKEREATDINSVIGYKAKMLSLLIPKYVAKCGQHNICFLAVNQLRDIIAMGPFQAQPKDLKMMTLQKDMPGGNVLKYNAFQLLEMRIKKVLDGEKDYGFDGITSRVKCVKNKLFSPNIEIDIVGSFVNGFSNFWTNYNFLVETKRLSSGPWNYLANYSEKKFRTKDAENLHDTDEAFRKAFDDSINEAIKTEIIDKYSQSN
jgi:RecA/RadA recombinase